MHISSENQDETSSLELHTLLFSLTHGGTTFKQFLEDATVWANAVIEKTGEQKDVSEIRTQQ